MTDEYSVVLTKLVEKMKLENCTPEIDTGKIFITKPDINRPALQLAGFMEDFDNERIQIIGNVEHSYIKRQDNKEEIYDRFLSSGIPCVIFCNGFELEPALLETALNIRFRS